MADYITIINIWCDNLQVVSVPGNASVMRFQWSVVDWAQKYLHHFIVIPYYKSAGGSWTQASIVGSAPVVKSGGYYYYDYKVPASSVAKHVKFEVSPYYDEKKYKDSVVWKHHYSMSGAAVTTAWSNDNTDLTNRLDNAKKAYDAAKKDYEAAGKKWEQAAKAKTTTAAEMKAAAALWTECSKLYESEAKNATTAEKAYADAKTLAQKLGYSTTDIESKRATSAAYVTSANKAKDYAQSYAKSWKEKAAEKEKADKEAAAAAEKKKQRDAMVAKAVTAYNTATTYSANGKSTYNAGSYASAKSAYQNAVSYYSDAAYWYGEASKYATDDADKRSIDQKKTSCNTLNGDCDAAAKKCAGFIDAYNALQTERSAKPAAPSASYTQNASNITLDINCSAKWSTQIVIYKEVDGNGKFTVAKTITRSLKKEFNAETNTTTEKGEAWAPQQWKDASIAAGHSYRYYLESVTMTGTKSDRTAYSSSFATKPTQPEDLELALDGYDANGKANVIVKWLNTCTTATEIQVQYTTWYGTQNAWLAAAWDKITTKKASTGQSTTYTITGIDPENTLYVRVKAVNAISGAWAFIKGGKDKGHVTASLKIPAKPVPPLNEPTALKAALQSGTASNVTLTWTDKQEKGVPYTIEHSANANAWKVNALGDITTEQFDDASASGQSKAATHTYTVTGVESGKRYYRVAKSKAGTAKVYAIAATGASKHDNTTCFAVTTEPAPTITAPTNLAAAKSGDTSVLLTWSDPNQAEGDTYEIQRADYSTAFADNAVGDITSETSDEVTTAATKRYTATQLERGRTWYFRVRKKSGDGVSTWLGVKSVKLPGETVREPTGLKASAVQGDDTRINVTWTDAPEAGTAYTMRIAPSLRAFTNNAVAEITEATYTPSTSTADNQCQYEFVGLTPGTTYYIQAVKTTGDVRKHAKAASGISKADAYTVFLELPASPSMSVSVPTDVTAEPRTVGEVLVVEGDGSKAAVQVSWEDQKGDGETYEVNYTNDAYAFADNAVGYIQSLEFESVEEQSHTVAVTGLDRGQTWYFRVRKKTSEDQGDWSDVASCMLESEPEAAEELGPPTVVDTMGGYASDETITLAWTHNSAQNSVQSGYQIEVTVTKPEGLPFIRTVETDEPTSNNVYVINVAAWGLSGDGTKVEWRVRTCGAEFGAYSPWSVMQSFSVYNRPAAYVVVPQEFEGFPVEVELGAESSGGGELSDENAPISYTLEIAANEPYDHGGPDGRSIHVAAGQVVYTRSIDSRSPDFAPTGWTVEVGAMDASFASGVEYLVRGTVVTAQGMRDEAGAPFVMLWDGSVPEPSCVARLDIEEYTVTLIPFCGAVEEPQEGDQDIPDVPDLEELTPSEREQLDIWPGTDVPINYAPGNVDEMESEFMGMPYIGEELAEGVVLSVYRVTDSGAVEIASGMPNDGVTGCVDPHPDFGTTTYRIIATDTTTGMQAASEFEVEVDVDLIVIQWDEQWSEGALEGLNPNYMGNRVELERNKDTSEQYAHDVALRRYAGRSHPVSYYGTQKGQTAKLNAVVVKGYESETLAKVRELAAWPGDCYVREPLGTGYWANVRPSVTTAHGSAAVAIALEVARVEGGK